VFAGYWGDDSATRAVLTDDGWLRTGDVAVLDERGELRLVDRAKDLVIVSGFNVYPAEVEEVLMSHPRVSEAAVIGEPDARTGEAVVAYVTLTPGAPVAPESLMAYCATALARYKCPTRVEIVDELPHTLAGKLLRRALRGR
jgi:long-chain acyl-CoA synthetase